MKKLFNLLILMFFISTSTFVLAEDEITFFDFNSVNDPDPEPGTGEELDNDTAPIDDYIPILFVGGAILGFAYRQKKKVY